MRSARCTLTISRRPGPSTSTSVSSVSLISEMSVQADFVYRKGEHGTPGGFFGASVDYNRFNAIGGPVIPACASTAQANDPTAQCSAGPINFWWPGATSTYKALLVKVDKRFSSRYQFTVSYALQSSKSIRTSRRTSNDYFATYGPERRVITWRLAGMVDLRMGIQISWCRHSRAAAGGADHQRLRQHRHELLEHGYTPLLGILGKGYSDFLSKSELEDSREADTTRRIAGTLTPAGKAGVTREPAIPGRLRCRPTIDSATSSRRRTSA